MMSFNKDFLEKGSKVVTKAMQEFDKTNTSSLPFELNIANEEKESAPANLSEQIGFKRWENKTAKDDRLKFSDNELRENERLRVSSFTNHQRLITTAMNGDLKIERFSKKRR